MSSRELKMKELSMMHESPLTDQECRNIIGSVCLGGDMKDYR